MNLTPAADQAIEVGQVSLDLRSQALIHRSRLALLADITGKLAGMTNLAARICAVAQFVLSISENFTRSSWKYPEIPLLGRFGRLLDPAYHLLRTRCHGAVGIQPQVFFELLQGSVRVVFAQSDVP